jgi:putative hydrolase of the HAD superfamily
MKAILFDFGGTLDNPGIHWFEFIKTFYAKYSIKCDEDILREAFVYAERELGVRIKREDDLTDTLHKMYSYQFDYLERRLGMPLDISLIMKIVLSCEREIRSYVNSIIPLLTELNNKFKLGIISNYYGNLETVVGDLKIKNLFTVLVDSNIEGIRKPDYRIYLTALKKLDARPEEVTMVGDSYKNDICPASQLGCRTVWLKNKTWKTEEEQLCADYIITDLSDIKNILELNN